METNNTWMDYFIIKGITDLPELQAPIFILVLLIYLIIVIGNSTLFLLICTDHNLNTPMYYFVSHLSIMDICYTTVTTHKTLDMYVSGNIRVSVSACIAQMYFYVTLLCCEFILLTAMSYDRYIAICYPLRYVTIMSSKVCSLLSSACWVLGFTEVLPAIYVVYDIHCFKGNKINHFFCDLLAIMKLFCHDATKMEHLVYVESVFVGFLPFTLTIMSYVYIIQTILRIHSSTGRHKAFYTCSSHITVVSLLYVCLMCLYLRPTSSFTLDIDKIVSLIITTLTPMLNPLIYSFKNKDVKKAFGHLIVINNKELLRFRNKFSAPIHVSLKSKSLKS